MSSDLFPTPLSWGYPHLEVFALIPNTNVSVQWTWRNSTAGGLSAWNLQNGSLEIVGGAIGEPSTGVAATVRGTHNVDIAILGNGNNWAYTESHTTSFVWQPNGPEHWGAALGALAGVCSSPPGIFASGEGGSDVFIIGPSPGYELYYGYFN